MLRRLLCTLALVALPAAVLAQTESQTGGQTAPQTTARPTCAGTDLLVDLPAPEAEALAAAMEGQSYPEGNHWLARKGVAEITVIGTLHMFDPRMTAIMDNLAPAVEAADVLLVEATEAEMAKMQAEIGRRPDLLFLTEGPSLLERLTPAEWAQLSGELTERGIPGMMAAKMQPWYVAMMLGMPACAMPQAGEAMQGLDKMLMDSAAEAGTPTRALEAYDTVFDIFSRFTIDQQLDMIRASLPLADAAEDVFATLTAAYFAEEHRRIWEFSRLMTLSAPGADPVQAEADFDLLERALLTERNRAWMEVIEAEAGDGTAPRKLVVAAGAAHLSGPDGVLTLLAADGWELERQPF
ncbi:TraB/GumN family protein [Frigidibacter sp.]|uniref:TraB/GumN family protein n=1 Tax=Frigidibacter sp. TaxID=2586418 RepID=UPI0027349DB8|nr:TraB/GumN family protein [Frigidibacter sp.]MDP3341166.1 TraB/GumN family protein [Frigidibacter sp.]